MVRKRLVALAAVCCLVACPAALLAADPAHGGAEAGHASEAGKPPLLSFDPGTAIWSIIVFVVLLIILSQVAWKPILKGLQERERFIADSIAQAKRDREEAEKRLAEHTAQLNKARDEASAIVAEGRRDAEAVRAQIKDDAQKDAQAMLDRAKREITLARDTAVKDIYVLGSQLATDAAAKILGRQLNAQDHERLIQESIEEIASRRR